MPLSSGGGSIVYVGGEQGPMGPEGPQGPIGPEGPQGPIGPKGDQGIQGVAGADGAAGVDGADGLQGPAGPQGPKGDPGTAGATGPQGPAGPQGNRGPKGDTGARGPAGVQGPAGPTGPQGPKGDKGDVGPTGPQGAAGPAGLDGKSIVSATVNENNEMIFTMDDATQVTSDPIEGGEGALVGSVSLFANDPGMPYLVTDGSIYDPVALPELAASGLSADEVNPGGTQFDSATFQSYLATAALKGFGSSEWFEFNDDYWALSGGDYNGVLLHKGDHSLSKSFTLQKGGTNLTYADKVAFIPSGDPSFIYVVYRPDYAGNHELGKVSTSLGVGDTVALAIYDEVVLGTTFQNFPKATMFEGELVIYHPNYTRLTSTDFATFTEHGSSAFAGAVLHELKVRGSHLVASTNVGIQVFASLADFKNDVYTTLPVTLDNYTFASSIAHCDSKNKTAFVQDTVNTLTIWDPVGDTYTESDPMVDLNAFDAKVNSVTAVADGFICMTYNANSTSRSNLFFVAADTGAVSHVADLGADSGYIAWSNAPMVLYDEPTQVLSTFILNGDYSAKYAVAVIEEYLRKLPTGVANGNMLPYIKVQ